VKKIYNFLHLPVQSGSDKILSKMNRMHSVEEFEEIISKVKEKRTPFLIATDIIVGFPGESEADFEKTVSLIKRTAPHIINITRYSERPGTAAEKLEDMPSRIKKERSRKLTKVSKKIRLKDNKMEKGKSYETLIVREGKKGTKLGRTPTGKAIILKDVEVGEKIKARVTGFKDNYLIGEKI